MYSGFAMLSSLNLLIQRVGTMKKILTIIIFFSVLISGCSSEEAEMDRALSIRKRLLDSNGCTFDALITADYGSKVYQFNMTCMADKSGNLTFTVQEPESIQGISGKIADQKGALTFDDRVLAFEMLADGQVTPVTAPWLFVKTLRSGYLSSCTVYEDGLRMTIHDSYEEDALELQIWTDMQEAPIRAEILFRGRRILTLQVANFTYL